MANVPISLILTVDKIKPAADITWKIGTTSHPADLETQPNSGVDAGTFNVIGMYEHTFPRDPPSVTVSWIIVSDPHMEDTYTTLPVWCKSCFPVFTVELLLL